ncbi:MAG: autotransporter-associated beta strand repeat-containing protein [Thermoguttaceae bacterium]|nr:autotransporter-associated beta strand repeat-containing protein [Thermoguttaceae bacterium]
MKRSSFKKIRTSITCSALALLLSSSAAMPVLAADTVYDQDTVTNLNADGYGASVKVGCNETGAMTVSAGTVNIKNSNSSSASYGSLSLGTNISEVANTQANGTLNITGGTVQVDGRILIAANARPNKSITAAATLNLSGGTLSLGVPGKYTTSGDPACGVLWFGNGTATLNLNGGTLQYYGMLGHNDGKYTVNLNGTTIKPVANNDSNFFLNSANASYVIKSGGAKFDTNGFNVTIAQPLTGTGKLEKWGAGTLTLSGDSTYSGDWTAISGGTFKLTGSLNGTKFRVYNADAVIDAPGKTSTFHADSWNDSFQLGTMANNTVSSLTIKAGTVNVKNTSGGAYGSIVLSSWSGANSTLTIDGGMLHTDGRLITAPNNTNSRATINLKSGTLDLGIPGKYTVDGDPACGVIWLGDGTQTFNLDGGTLNMFAVKTTNNTVGTTFNLNGTEICAVADMNTASAQHGFLLKKDKVVYSVKEGGAKFNTKEFDVLITPNLDGSANDGGLTKLGNGTLTLSGENTWNGPTNVTAGTLKLGADKALSANSQAIAVADGAVLDLAGTNPAVNAGTVSGTIRNSASGTSMLTLNAPVKFSASTGTGVNVKAMEKFTPANAQIDGTLEIVGDLNWDFSLLNTETALLTANEIIWGNDAEMSAENFVLENAAEYDLVKLLELEETPSSEFTAALGDFLLDISGDLLSLGQNGSSFFAVYGAPSIPSEPGSGVPEPSAWILLVLGTIGLAYAKRFDKTAKN